MSQQNGPGDTHTTLKPLKSGEVAFIDAYFANNMNATAAYREKHPKAGYLTARKEGYLYTTKPNVQAEISRRLSEMAMPPDEAIARMGDIARASMFPFVRITDDGFVYFNFADPDARAHMHIIKKIKSKRERRLEGQGEASEVWEGEWVEVELHDAKAALDTILKMHGKLRDPGEGMGLNLNIDFSKLSTEQIKAIQNAKNRDEILAIISDTSGGGA